MVSLDIFKSKLILHVVRQRTHTVYSIYGYVSCIKTNPKGTGYDVKCIYQAKDSGRILEK